MATREAVLSQFGEIDWDGIARTGLIEQDEAELLRRTEDVGLEYILADSHDAAKFAIVLLRVCKNVTNDNLAQQYALTRIEDVLNDDLQTVKRNAVCCTPHPLSAPPSQQKCMFLFLFVSVE